MKNMKLIVWIAVAVVVVVGGSFLGYYLYQDSHYLSTENAQVTADMVTVMPEVTGKLNIWNVKEGDMVKEGQVLGHQDTGSLITSSAISSQALTTTADAIANKADIKSPIAGMVISSNVVKGQVVAPGTSVAVIADTANMYVRASIKETSILKIKPGQKVGITIDALPGKSFIGYVKEIGRAAESVFSPIPTLNTSGEFSKTTQLIPVNISLNTDGNPSIVPGMNAVVKINIQ